LSAELEHRPAWAVISIRAILQLLSTPTADST
jgi:hypothetical protein